VLLLVTVKAKHKYFYGYTHKKSDAAKDGTWLPATRAPFCPGEACVTRPKEYTLQASCHISLGTVSTPREENAPPYKPPPLGSLLRSVMQLGSMSGAASLLGNRFVYNAVTLQPRSREQQI
jgi:hypothetical protein